MDLMNKYPRIDDLESVAKRRIPPVVWAYLYAGTGTNRLKEANRAAFDGVSLVPRILSGHVSPRTEVTIFGQTLSMPVGISPIGLASMIWPGAELMMARAAAAAKVPMTLSTVAGESLENVAQAAGEYGWFQLYPPKDKTVRHDLLKRAKDSGYKTLMVTVDVPTSSRREDMRKAGAPIGSRNSSSFTPRVIWQSMNCPRWAMAMLKAGGKMRFKNLEPYVSSSELADISKFIGSQLNAGTGWDVIDDIRAHWQGNLVVKGVLHPDDAVELVRRGVDGLVVSNHGGRQFDGGPASITRLPLIRQAVGPDVFVAVDSGIRSGLDVVRALALGADFAMLGRPFLYGAGALGTDGPAHILSILAEEYENALIQLGVSGPGELPSRLSSS